MWTTEVLASAHSLKLRAVSGAGPRSVDDVLRALAQDEAMRLELRTMFRTVPFEAYYWELPALCTQTLHRPFECVVTASELLAGMRPDWRDFSDPFRAAGKGSTIAVFDNLGGDALLLAPVPRRGSEPWTHLAAFAADADDVVWSALFEAVARCVRERLSDRPLWLSTSGTGVPWLHVRLDTTPKYYVHAPYRRAG